jgi:hypothetical protein
MVDALWRTALGCLSALLSAARQEALVVALLKGYQCYTYSAGALGAVAARDGLLASLCEYTLLSDSSAVQQAEAQVRRWQRGWAGPGAGPWGWAGPGWQQEPL